jgi:hypothetical protein
MPMTPDQAKALLGVLISYWPKADLPLQTLQLYQLHLLDFGFEQGTRAVTALACTSRFFPTVAELREALVEAGDPDPLPDTDQAWAEVARAARNGIYGRTVFSHPAVHDTVKAMGGIRELALSDNLMAERAHFLRLYDTCKRRAERAKVLPGGEVGKALEALAERLAAPDGHPTPEIGARP